MVLVRWVSFILVLGLSRAAVAAELRLAPYGAAAGDAFGRRLTLTDVDGDGHADLVVAAALSDAGGADSGSVTVYRGGPGLNAQPDLVLVGIAGERFGLAVAGGGDANGDGWSDVLVSAAGADGYGRVYLYYGGDALDAEPDRVFVSDTPNDAFGGSLAEIEDVDGDGLGDVIVGASGHGAGRVLVYSGDESVTEPLLVLDGEATGDAFGGAVAAPGDLDGDGFGDIVVGAWANSGLGGLAGRAYVYLGGAVPDDGIDLRLEPEGERDRFGFAVASAGDVDGDGHPDFLVAAPTQDAGGWDAGRAYLYRGGPTLDRAADLVLTGESSDDQFGWSMAGGDLDGDGRSEIVVSAPFFGERNPASGRVYVFCGGWPLDAQADETFDGEASQDLFGVGLAAGPDVTADGLGDFAVGAPQVDHGGPHAGRAYLYAGSGGTVAALTLDLEAVAGVAAPQLRWGVSGLRTGLEVELLRRTSGQDLVQRRWWVSPPADEGIVAVDVGERYLLRARGGEARSQVVAVEASGPEGIVAVRPNPASGGLRIALELPRGGPVRLQVHDARGRRVRDLARPEFGAGHRELFWDGRDETGRSVAAGVYHLSVIASGRVYTTTVTVSPAIR